MESDNKLNVAVLMGGRTAEHEISLKSGKEITFGLDKNKYRVKPIKIEKNGEWIIPSGYIDNTVSLQEKEAEEFKILDTNGNICKLNISEDVWPASLNSGNIEAIRPGGREKVDVVFIALHGPYGEDGTVQGLLEMMNIPYTGSDVLSSALAMNKGKCKEIYIYNGIKVPDFVLCNQWQWEKSEGKIIQEIESRLNYPCVVKPSSLGSSVGIHIAENQDELKIRISKALKYDNIVLIERYLKGTEITCPVLGGLSGEEPFALPLVEIVPPDNARFFDYDVKYDGTTREIVPAVISEELTLLAQEIGVKVHKILGCTGMSRTDMIITGEEIYVLETNTIPGMTKESLYPQAARASGMTFSCLLDRLIELALDAHKHKKIKTERK